MSASNTSDTQTRIVTILNQKGLHARAAARFVKTAGEFKSDIAVTRGGQTVSGMSIMGLMMLAAGIGSEIELTCSGSDAELAMQALTDMISNKFEEE